ncbi:SIMPL domain-containing protein [Hippea alviniae]|uniref:SIMPL domain-containing protein n=1 Tax=Hippea alviniae TaxID=1279027 RepID=UPI0003B3E5DD|nr:SIMPL domain-containing protein [Hippea alviniae]
MRRESGWSGFWCGLFIAVGLVVFGYFISTTAVKVKNMERTVSVKGLAERLVKADIAIYPIRFDVADNNPLKLYDKIKASKSAILKFLKDEGFSQDEIFISPPQITDNYASGFNQNAKFRYSAVGVITVYTNKVDKVVSLGKDLYKLTQMGIMASNEKFQTNYLFTHLNKIKPIMVEEAIKNAQKAAEQFAMQSHSKLGKIKTASQGYFSITDRDPNTPYIKRVRVVVRVVYYLR